MNKIIQKTGTNTVKKEVRCDFFSYKIEKSSEKIQENGLNRFRLELKNNNSKEALFNDVNSILKLLESIPKKGFVSVEDLTFLNIPIIGSIYTKLKHGFDVDKESNPNSKTDLEYVDSKANNSTPNLGSDKSTPNLGSDKSTPKLGTDKSNPDLEDSGISPKPLEPSASEIDFGVSPDSPSPLASNPFHSTSETAFGEGEDDEAEAEDESKSPKQDNDFVFIYKWIYNMVILNLYKEMLVRQNIDLDREGIEGDEGDEEDEGDGNGNGVEGSEGEGSEGGVEGVEDILIGNRVAEVGFGIGDRVEGDRVVEEVGNGDGDRVDDVDGEDDFSIDYKNLMDKLFSQLDPSIRIKLTKRGLTIYHNIYTGFDTEYKNRDSMFNDLLSVQLAVNTRTFLKIPLNTKYSLSSVSVLTNKVYKIPKTVSEINFEMIEENIAHCIDEIRLLKYYSNDSVMDGLVKGFNKLSISNPNFIKVFEKDNVLVVSFKRSSIANKVYLKKDDQVLSYSFSALLSKSKELGINDLEKDYENITDLIYKINNVKLDTLNNWVKDDLNLSNMDISVTNGVSNDDVEYCVKHKKSSRTLLRGFNGDSPINVNRIWHNYVIAHLTSADLSMLSDFEQLKDHLNIVNKCFITIGRPLNWEGFNVTIRDTMLLAPGGKKSLASIGELHNYPKIFLTSEEYKNMDLFLKNDEAKFVKYAITDSVIALLHANYMEDLHFESRFLGIPISLSSLGANYVYDEWDKAGYKGYQVSRDYLIGNSAVTQTPKGLFVTKSIGLNISMYIANYKGGRGESFMYGVDESTEWFDYDLKAAYTTAMAALGNPDYKNAKNLTLAELNKMSEEDLIFNYIVMSVKFKFPPDVKYPSIPCYMDETTTVYPLRGEAILTGAEYVLAKRQKCVFHVIRDVFCIPFERQFDENTKKFSLVNKPFEVIIKELQAKRESHPKKSLGNLMEKEKGNSIYGNTVKGISNKMKYDVKTRRTIRMEGGLLSNPIIASWTTAFIRCIIGECLHNISILGGQIVSVTTDGFITNLSDLEIKIKGLNTNIFLNNYTKIRQNLTGDDLASGLELKSSGLGIISWTTRGQFSLEANISAATGFQTRALDKKFLNTLYKNTMSKEDRVIEFIQTSLRSAKEIFLKGGHVTNKFEGRVFRMEFDNKRIITLPPNLIGSNDFSSILLDSKPAEDLKTVQSLRFLSKIHKTKIYNRFTSKSISYKYKNTVDIAIRCFIVACISDPPRFNLKPFDSYTDIIQFVKLFKPDFKVSKASISRLKSRKDLVRSVPMSRDCEDFVKYIKHKFPDFDSKSFFDP